MAKGWTEERRKAQSEAMKAYWAKKKAAAEPSLLDRFLAFIGLRQRA